MCSLSPLHINKAIKKGTHNESKTRFRLQYSGLFQVVHITLIHGVFSENWSQDETSPYEEQLNNLRILKLGELIFKDMKYCNVKEETFLCYINFIRIETNDISYSETDWGSKNFLKSGLSTENTAVGGTSSWEPICLDIVEQKPLWFFLLLDPVFLDSLSFPIPAFLPPMFSWSMYVNSFQKMLG